MNHVWTVTQDGKELGTVEAVSRKGAYHEAYIKFGIASEKRKTITVEKAERRFLAIDPAAWGGDKTVHTEMSQDALGDVVCSFNPNLARQ